MAHEWTMKGDAAMGPRSAVAFRILGCLAVAATCLALERQLRALAEDRPGVFPIAMCALIWGLLVPRMRQTIIVALCFGISLIAARYGLDAGLNGVATEGEGDLAWLEVAYPLVWAAISVLTAVAGTMEAVGPGSIGAARCYFGAVALYMVGHGWLMWLRQSYGAAVVAAAIAVAAVAAVVFTRQFIGATRNGGPRDGERGQPLDEDLEELRRRSAARAAALEAKEWKEPKDPDEPAKRRARLR